MFDPKRLTSGYALTWPRELFRDELGAVVDYLDDQDQRSAIDLLFEEALTGPHPREDLAEISDGPSPTPFDPWAPEPHPSDEEPPANFCRDFGRYVLAHVDDLPVHTPRLYYLQRQQEPVPAEPPGPPDWPVVQREWTTIVEDLVDRGYLDRRAGDACEDRKDNEQPGNLNELILGCCGIAVQWPPALGIGGSTTGPDVLFTLVEVFHDLVARPRTRSWHGYDEHYWYDRFDDDAGQAVYRWRVNQLFDQHLVDYQLAADGEDVGFVVRSTADPRRELIREVQQNVADGNESRVAHAVSLFRRRESTLEDKRSACKALADVLENRRPLIQANLNSKDAGDLFLIANNFGIRHHDGKQRLDYPEDYLDWIFWWYLATVELTNRLIARAGAAND